MPLNKGEAFSELDASRARLLELLEGLSEDQWDTQTLAEGWRVREVASHMASGSSMKTGTAVLGMLKARMNFDKFNDRSARQLGQRPVAEILEHFRAEVGSRKLPPTVSAQQFLVDAIIHTYDVAIPLGLDVEIQPRQLTAVLEKAVTLGDPFGCRQRCEGMRLVAPDLDWSWGNGPELRGPGAAVLMGIAGRGAALDQLDGEGVEVLRSRL